MNERGRHIAFDYGDTRIGVAISDPDRILATPLPFIPTKNRLPLIKELLIEYSPTQIYVGKPLHLSGAAGAAVEKVESFVDEISVFDIPITFIDERMTTLSAASKLRAAGVSAKDQRDLIDSMSAVAILEAGFVCQ